MSTVEDRIRAATQAAAETVTPGSVPPLQLPEGRDGARRHYRWPLRPAPRRWSGLLVPLAAAAAVIGMVAAALAIGAAFHGNARPAGPATQSHPSPAPQRPAPLGQAALHQVPRYFAALTLRIQEQAQMAVVRSTLTGQVLAAVTPPPPYQIFTWVSAAADDRTFVLAAQRYWPIASGQAGMPAENRDNTTPTAFFKMTFDPATRTAKLARLAVPETIQHGELAGMTVSPDGSRLALDLGQSIQVVTLTTGAVRSWAWPGGGWIGYNKPCCQVFSWTADGTTLAFPQRNGSSGELSLSFLAAIAGTLAAAVLTVILVRRWVRVRRADRLAWTIAAAAITIALAVHAFDAYRSLAPEATNIRLLDTTAPGTSLASARIVLTFPDVGALGSNTLLTPDGSRIVTVTPQGITEFSARTGQPILSEDQFPAAQFPAGGPQEVDLQSMLWAGPGGRALVVSDPRGKRTRYGPDTILGVLTGNTFTPIPNGTYDGAFLQLAW
jgi:hypothetical protein